MPRKGRGRGKKSNLAVKSKANHEEDEPLPLVCSFCSESFHQTAEFEDHIHQPHSQCQYCDLYFIREDQLKKHLSEFHKEASRQHLSGQLNQGLSGGGEVQGAEGVSPEVGQDEVSESPDSLEEKGEEDCPESQREEESEDVESPEEDISEGREGLEPRGDCSTGGLENESPEAEAEATICPECAPVVERMLANITRRVLQQIQE